MADIINVDIKHLKAGEVNLGVSRDPYQTCFFAISGCLCFR